MNHRIFPLSENAVTIDFGNKISTEINEKVIQLADLIERNKFDGLIEIVPAYSSLTIFYDISCVRRHYTKFPNAFSFVENFIESSLKKVEKLKVKSRKPILIPVDYSLEFALDLEFVAQYANLSQEEVIKIHTSKIYRVFMIGFLPGFAYMGELDKRIAAPRRENPRTKIEKGSVGIAGKQTGIYPLESPGGWQIIGKTDLDLFIPNKKEISLLKTGDLVAFYDINQK